MRRGVAVLGIVAIIAATGLLVKMQYDILVNQYLIEMLSEHVTELLARNMAQEDRLISMRVALYNLEKEMTELTKALEKWQVIEVWSTGYAPFDNQSGICTDGNPWSTATGTMPRVGTVAVNPRVIPYGTNMYIEGYGWGRAEDTGSMIRARTDLIDLFFETYEEAMAWGRRLVRVLVEVQK